MSKNNRLLVDVKNNNEKEYFFELFIYKNTLLSKNAINNIKLILNKYLKNKFQLIITDVDKLPEATIKEDILIMPILIKRNPKPEIRIIGDFTNPKKVLKELLIN